VLGKCRGVGAEGAHACAIVVHSPGLADVLEHWDHVFLLAMGKLLVCFLDVGRHVAVALHVLLSLIQMHFEIDTTRLLMQHEWLLSAVVFVLARLEDFLERALQDVGVDPAAFGPRTAQARLAWRILLQNFSAAIVLFFNFKFGLFL